MKNQVDYLIEGEYSELADDPLFYEATASVPTTNQTGEADFALLRSIKEAMPRLSHSNLEARIKLKRNKPVTEYLDSKSQHEKSKIMTEATKSFKDREAQIRVNDKKYKEGLKAKREKRILSKREKEQTDGKRNLEIMKCWSQEFGAIWLPEEIDSKLEKIESEELKLKATNALIEYYHYICNAQSSNKDLFHKTKAKKAFTFQEKYLHLQQLLEQNPYLFENPKTTDEGTRLDITLAADKVVQLIDEKSSDDDRKRHIKASKLQLPSLTENPDQLICKRMVYKQLEGVEVNWVTGKILHKIGEYRRKLYFAVKLDGDQEEKHVAVLYEIRRGQLALLPQDDE